MKYKKILEVLFLLFIFTLSFTTLESISIVNNANSIQDTTVLNSEPLTPSMIFNNINEYLTDHTNGGYISNRSIDGSFVNTSKNINDYISAVNFIVTFTKDSKNNSYLTLIPNYLNLIEKFNSQGGYYSVLSANWSVLPNTYFGSSTLGSLIAMYSNLYNLTLTNAYLTKAVSIESYLEKNFYDPIYGGFYAQINPHTLKFNPKVDRMTSTNGIIANALYDLYLDTNNDTIFQNGLDLLNNTISITYNSINNYFKPQIFESTNTIDNSNTGLIVNVQVILATSLIEYANLANNTVKSNFNSIVSNLTSVLFVNTVNFNGLIMNSYNTFSNQLDIYNYLLLFNSSTENTKNIKYYFTNSSTIYYDFFSNNIDLFFNNPSTISPFINFEALITYENLNYNNYSLSLIYISTTIIPASLLQNIMPFLFFGVPIVIILAIMYLRRKERKRLGNLIGQSAPVHRNYIRSVQKEPNLVTPVPTTKICNNCHQQNSKEDVFCKNCGQRM